MRTCEEWRWGDSFPPLNWKVRIAPKSGYILPGMWSQDDDDDDDDGKTTKFQ